MWIAFINDVGISLAELAGSYIHKDNLDRLSAYQKAFNSLQLSL